MRHHPTAATFATINGHDLHYVDEGAGPALVFAHGWGFDHTSFRPLMDELSQHFRAVAYDLRGHGRSAPSDQRYDLRDLASDLAGLVAHLDLPSPPVVVGHSLGGAVAQQLAVDYPDVARAIVILDADLNTRSNRALMEVGTRLSAGALRLMAALAGDRRVMRLVPPMLNPMAYSGSWRRAHRQALREDARRFPDHNTLNDLVWSLRAWGSRPNLAEALGAVTQPTLVMRGDKDPIVSARKLQRLAQSIPGARLETVAGAGHTVIAERPGVVAASLKAFVGQLEAKPSDRAA